MTYIHILNKIKNFSELDQIKAMASFEYIIVIPNWLLGHINSITCKYLSFQSYNLNYWSFLGISEGNFWETHGFKNGLLSWIIFFLFV